MKSLKNILRLWPLLSFSLAILGCSKSSPSGSLPQDSLSCSLTFTPQYPTVTIGTSQTGLSGIDGVIRAAFVSNTYYYLLSVDVVNANPLGNYKLGIYITDTLANGMATGISQLQKKTYLRKASNFPIQTGLLSTTYGSQGSIVEWEGVPPYSLSAFYSSFAMPYSKVTITNIYTRTIGNSTTTYADGNFDATMLGGTSIYLGMVEVTGNFIGIPLTN